MSARDRNDAFRIGLTFLRADEVYPKLVRKLVWIARDEEAFRRLTERIQSWPASETEEVYKAIEYIRWPNSLRCVDELIDQLRLQKKEALDYVPQPKKVLYLLYSALPFRISGNTTRTDAILTQLCKEGYEVVGVTSPGFPFDQANFEESLIPEDAVKEGNDWVYRINGVKYVINSTLHVRRRRVTAMEYAALWVEHLVEVCRRERPALIHASSFWQNGIVGAMVAKRLGIPYIYEIRGFHLSYSQEMNRSTSDNEVDVSHFRMEAEAASHAHRLFTITEAAREEMVMRGVPQENIGLLPNGVNVTRFEPRPCDEALKATLGLAGKKVIGFVGSLLDYEGIDTLLKAASLLRSQGRKDFAVLIVGSGKARSEFEAEQKALRLENLVVFTGRVAPDEVPRYYSLVDIAPFPRHSTRITEIISPIKPFEAMGMRKAVIVSDVRALREIVIPEETGLIHRAGDAGDLAQQIKRLLDDPHLHERLAENGRKWVNANRDWSHVTREVCATYRELL